MTRTPPEVPAESPESPQDRKLSVESRLAGSARGDVRADRRARWLQAFGWAAFPSLFLGVPIWAAFGATEGILAMAGILLGAGGGAVLISEGVGELVGAVTNPRGRARPPHHSGAEALVARGEHEAAISLLRASLEEFPDDGEAMLKIARIRARETGESRRAIVEFRRARGAGVLSPREMRLTMREMLEAARAAGHPHLVVADLRQHLEAFEATDEVEWATRELRRLNPPGAASAS